MALTACETTSKRKPINYGTVGVGSISSTQSRALLNCYLAGTSATKIVELRSEGKTDREIIKYYSDRIDSSWLKLIHDLLPVVNEDNPDPSSQIGYGRDVYGRCLGTLFDQKNKQVAEYCYQLNQFLYIAFGFRDLREPLEKAYTIMPAGEKERFITDDFLLRAKEVGKSQENNFRIDAYYGCLGML